MNKIVFLLEEPSMKSLLEGLLPRMFPDIMFQYIAHEGKNDLEKSIPRKLRAWREPGVRFIVLRDKDQNDCMSLKQRLLAMCEEAGRPDTLVRIVCYELESWYLGDPEALAQAFGDNQLRRIDQRARFRDPDSVQQPADALRSLVPGFQKVAGARKMADVISRQRNRSHSFQVLMSGIDRLCSEK